jgi:hypothetical protein
MSIWDALILGLAIIMPGGLLVYFGYKAYKHHEKPKNSEQSCKP